MLGLAIILSVVFAVLKIVGLIGLSWWFVIVPELFVFVVFFLFAAIAGTIIYKHERTIYNSLLKDNKLIKPTNIRYGRLK